MDGPLPSCLSPLLLFSCLYLLGPEFQFQGTKVRRFSPSPPPPPHVTHLTWKSNGHVPYRTAVDIFCIWGFLIVRRSRVLYFHQENMGSVSIHVQHFLLCCITSNSVATVNHELELMFLPQKWAMEKLVTNLNLLFIQNNLCHKGRGWRIESLWFWLHLLCSPSQAQAERKKIT